MVSVQEFFDKATSTLTYLVYDSLTKDAIVIDPVLNFDPASGKASRLSVKTLLTVVSEKGLRLLFSLETHAHADHLSGSQELKKFLPNIKVAIGERITEVQKIFKPVFGLAEDFPVDGRQFDRLLKDGESFDAGSIQVKVMSTPGHTPACVTYVIDNNVFTGDALFMPDGGTGRCDFPLGSAKGLYHSIQKKIYSLPGTHKVFTGHDYQPNGRELRFQSTIDEEKRTNIHLKAETTEVEFVEFRTGRDKKLDAPKLLLPSVQVNIDGGRLPKPERNGISYLKIPIAMEE